MEHSNTKDQYLATMEKETTDSLSKNTSFKILMSPYNEQFWHFEQKRFQCQNKINSFLKINTRH